MRCATRPPWSGSAWTFPTCPCYADVNVTGTAVLLEAMGRHEIPRLVFASSMVVYGEGAYDCAAHGRSPAVAPGSR